MPVVKKISQIILLFSYGNSSHRAVRHTVLQILLHICLSKEEKLNNWNEKEKCMREFKKVTIFSKKNYFLFTVYLSHVRTSSLKIFIRNPSSTAKPFMSENPKLLEDLVFRFKISLSQTRERTADQQVFAQIRGNFYIFVNQNFFIYVRVGSCAWWIHIAVPSLISKQIHFLAITDCMIISRLQILPPFFFFKRRRGSIYIETR